MQQNIRTSLQVGLRGKPHIVVLSAVAAVILFLYISLRSPSGSAGLPVHSTHITADGGAPVRRTFAADLTEGLRQALAHYSIKHLLVLAAESDQQLAITWTKLRVDVYFASTVDQLLLLLDSPPYSTCASASALRPSSRGVLHRDTAAATRTDGSQVMFLHAAGQAAGSSRGSQSSSGNSIPTAQASVGAASIALLVKTHHGALPLRHIRLMTAATGKLQQCLAFTAAYGTYQDKGDSLIVLQGNDEPVSAAFKSTNVFRDKFSAIYDTQFWGSGEYNGGGSGYGSSLKFTENVRALLTDLINRYDIDSMLDSSCGSMHWMPIVLREVAASRPDFKFMGTDVACSLIGNHTKRFANESNWRFGCVDYANQPLPTGYQLIWSRDSLQHLPMHAAWMFLNNVKASGAQYLLVGSYIASKAGNVDISAGEYYPIDLLKPPFSLKPTPLEVLDEKTEDGKHLLLFDVRQLTWHDDLHGLI